jgi:Concanavalin A-like lectin/glucanases superfamily/PKD domain
MQKKLMSGLALLLVLLFIGTSHAGFTIGGFDTSRGGYYSFPSGGYLTEARSSLSAHFPGVSYVSFPQLTQQSLSGLDILMLSVGTSNVSATTPLTTSEQSALLTFVKNGGCAVLFPDNSSFDWIAPVVNESLIDPFGMDSTGTLYGGVVATVRVDGSPVTDGRFGTVRTLYQNYPGGLTNLGPYASPVATNPLGTALAYIESGAVSPGSGRVVVYTDVNSFGNESVAGMYYSNEALFLNTIDYCTQPLIGGSCIQPPSGMVGWWPGDGNADDVVGTNHGTAVNGATYADGKVGKAFSFDDAQRQHVTIPHRPELDLSNSLTIDLWAMKKGSCEDLNCWMVAKGNKDYSFDTQNGRYGMFISDASYWPLEQNNRVGLSFNTGSWQDVVMGTTKIENNVWYHIAGTWDGSVAKVYVNGVLEKSVPKTGTILPTTEGGSLAIGAEIFGDSYVPNGEHFEGLIDEVEIFNRALSADEIKAIYRVGSAGKCKPENRPPVAKAAAATTECSAMSATPVVLDGSGSLDPDRDPLTYTWTWKDGSASGVSPTAIFSFGTTSVTLTVSDGKGGTSSDTIPVTVQDTIAPATTATVSGTSGQNGWYVSDVTIRLNSTDTCTGVKEIHYTINGVETVVPGSFASFTLSKDGSYEIYYWAVDAEVPKMLVINIDKTLPTITAVASPPANPYGWNNKEVTVIFSCSDTGAGIATCNGPVTMSTDGNQQSVVGTATDKAGNTASIEVKVNIDRTAPTLVITGVNDGETYPSCSAPKPAITATDTLSGILSQEGILKGGNENGVSVFTYTVTASDRAGNTAVNTATYRVAYEFGGFIAPVTLEKPFKKGSTIPVKFSLTDGCGHSVTTARATLTLTPVSSTVQDAAPIDATSNVPDSGNVFRYSGSDGIYIYNLATDSLGNGTYLATVTTDDGVVKTISVQIKQ